MFRRIAIVILFIISLSSTSNSQVPGFILKENISYGFTQSRGNTLINPKQSLLNYPPVNLKTFFQSDGIDFSSRNNIEIPGLKKSKKKKSVLLGTVLSAILPGAGEFYGESYVKAGIFLGLEILAWATYLYFDSKGDKKDEEFRKFADQNWDVRRYARWLNDEFDQTINWQEPDLQELRRQIILAEQELRFSHTLPEYYTQQYYEVIGKYQTFMGGWADAENGFGNWVVTGGTGGNYYTYQTPMFKFYAGERQKANDFYELARIGPIAAMLNHILSAADAAWTISSYNRKIMLETGFRVKSYRSPYTNFINYMPTFNMKFNF